MKLTTSRTLLRRVCCTFSGGALFAITASGCTVQTSDPAPVAVQTGPSALTLHWTVDEVADPNVCAMGSASTIDIVVTEANGQPGGEFQSSCETFSTTISTLPRGDYAGTVRLLDTQGNARTTAINLQPFTLIDDSTLVVTIDFPSNSFL